MNNVSLIRYSPEADNNLLTTQLVECYRNVFADAPWNEWLRCSKCQKYWGIKDRDFLASNNFHHCNTPLVDFWPTEEVVSDIHHEITSEASCWLAICNEEVIGFCWGYPITVSDLEIKLGIPFSIEVECLLGTSEMIAYQDEVGVLSAHRGHHVAKALVSHRLNDFLAKDLQIGIVRTRQEPEPSETFLWYTKKLGYKVLASYPDNDGRVILGRELSGLKSLLAH